MDQTAFSDFQRALRKRRKHLGLTQSDLASVAGVDRGTIAALETIPGRSCDLQTAQKLAGALKCLVDDLTASPEAA